jgi:hypothetical protein
MSVCTPEHVKNDCVEGLKKYESLRLQYSLVYAQYQWLYNICNPVHDQRLRSISAARQRKPPKECCHCCGSEKYNFKYHWWWLEKDLILPPNKIFKPNDVKGQVVAYIEEFNKVPPEIRDRCIKMREMCRVIEGEHKVLQNRYTELEERYLNLHKRCIKEITTEISNAMGNLLQ